MSAAGEPIPYGSAIRLIGGEWFRAAVVEMQAVAGRPISANGRPGWPARGHAYEKGEEVEARTDGGILMILSERCRLKDGRTMLVGDTAYVHLQAGKPIDLEPQP